MQTHQRAAQIWPILALAARNRHHLHFVFYKLHELDLVSFDTGASNPTVNRNLVHPVKVSWPPREEQRTIANFLDRVTATIDQMIDKVESAIELLQEYRSALITAVVTGKIDVREASQRLEDASKQAPGKGRIAV